MVTLSHFGFTVAAFFAAAAPLCAQGAAEEWEGKVVDEISAGKAEGWHRYRYSNLRDQLQLKKGQIYTKDKRDADYQTLFKTGHYNNLSIVPGPVVVDYYCKDHPAQRSPTKGNCPAPKCANNFIENFKWVVVISVDECEIVREVLFTGVTAFPINVLKNGLRLRENDMLNPVLIKSDFDYLREQYITKGYYFFTATYPENGKNVEGPEVIHTETGAIVHWRVFEGPIVTVKEVKFTGLSKKDDEEVRRYLQTRSPGSILSIIPLGGEPFVQRYLEEDLKRVKLYFFLEGWLDVGAGERVFIEDLQFSRDRSEVTVTIHADLGRRYKITKINFKGNKLFSEEELRTSLREAKEGADYGDNATNRDASRLRDKYGERAYILAEVIPSITVAQAAPEIVLTYSITENQEITIGKISINGNSKTRHDVILRELKDFTPGDKFNNKLLSRGIARLRDRGYFAQEQGGLVVRTEGGANPGERDVILDVKEGPTGNIRFAGGFSSSFGILGIIEFTQKNFDITDLPKSFDDLLSGNAFAGGGQSLRLRAAPAAKRQSYLAEFREPYVFGYEFGATLRLMDSVTTRRTYVEERLGASIGLDKRFDPVRVELRYEAQRINVSAIDIDAPVDTFATEGTNYLFTLTPAFVLDMRDSQLFPSEGLRVTLAYEFAGVWLGGDWDYGKFSLDTEYHIKLYEDDDKRKHVLTFEFKFGWSEPFRDTESLPIFERFYAGGRDSIRGFDFRGVGPHQNGEPIGGQARILGSIEYSWPLFGEFLRGAVFYDIANIAPTFDTLGDDKYRNTIGFGFRFLIPQLGNIPVALDFGFPLSKERDDERQTVTFDIGKLF